jgi:DNA-binding transcriptional MerR regulator
MADDDLLPIGRFGRATGLSPKALRLYADAGALVPALIDEATGYRHYRPDQVGTGQLVRTLRELGVPVTDLAGVLADLDRGVDASALLGPLVRADEQRAGNRRRLLTRLAERLESAPVTRTISTREWNAHPALRISAEVVHDDHDDYIGDSYQQLYTAAGRFLLTLSEPAYQRYHARVDDETTLVRIDVCLPFAPDRAQPGELPAGMDVLAARSMLLASTVMRGADATYPTILEGSDAVLEWMARHGYDGAGPAYEIVRSWHGEIGHPDNAFEVGFPIRDASDN